MAMPRFPGIDLRSLCYSRAAMLSEQVSFSQLRKWAADRHTLELSLAAGELPRVQALQMRGDTTDAVRIRGSLAFRNAAQGRPELAGKLETQLQLQCQRCLQPVAVPVAVRFRLLCLEYENELEELTVAEQRFDSLVAGTSGCDLRAVVEDEILASLPLAPKHVDRRECAVSAAVTAAEPEKTRPFAGLADMLATSGSSGNTRD